MEPKEEKTPEVEVQEKKNKGISKPVYFLSLIGVALLSILLTSLFQPKLAASQETSTLSASGTEVFDQSQLNQLETVYYYLKNAYVDKDIDPDSLIQGALKGMAQAAGDPYTVFLVNEEKAQLDDTVNGSFGGIGAELKSLNGQVMISTTMEGTPSRAAGLKENDVILKVDGEDMTNKTISEVVAKVRGEAGTDVVLTLLRNQEEIQVTITRATISIHTVNGNLDENDPSIGYIQITNFSTNTSQELQEKVEELKKQGAKSLIFDVRHNPGGLLDQALNISNMFLEEGQTIVQVEDRDGNTQSFVASKDYGEYKIDLPYVLLVDEGSASASEILAGAIKESAKGTLIGTTTFGKGTVQSVVEVGENSELKFTNAKWLTPSGTWIHEKGINPSQEVALPDYASLTLIDTSQDYELGQVSSNVETIESILAALDYQVTKDGYFDETTQKAVNEFQKKAGLTQSGKVDQETANALMDAIREKIATNDTQYQAAVQALKGN